MPTDHDSIVEALRREAFVAFRIKQGYANRIDSWHAGEIAFNAGWAAAVESLVAENARLRAALTDLRDHGTRHDITPTLVQKDGMTGGMAPSLGWYDYIKSMDSTVRVAAARALKGDD